MRHSNTDARSPARLRPMSFLTYSEPETAPMDKAKQKRLEAAGWQVGTVQDFLDLSPEESLLIDIRARLALALSERRKAQSLTQAELARRIRSSQSRVAKMEAADGSVSLDLLVRSLLALGTTRKELAAAIAGKKTSTPAPFVAFLSCRSHRETHRPTNPWFGSMAK